MTASSISVTVIGGGPESTGKDLCDSFCRSVHEGPIALFLAGDSESAGFFAPTYLNLLEPIAERVVVVPLEEQLPAVTDFGGVIVGGGPTPYYYSMLRPIAESIRSRDLTDAVPYLGFSAGGMIASEIALIGGRTCDGRVICPVEWAEGLDELTTVEGLGLIPYLVDAHSSQAGTLTRTLAAATRIPGREAVGLDEDSALVWNGFDIEFLGRGAAHWCVAQEIDETSLAVRTQVS